MGRLRLYPGGSSQVWEEARLLGSWQCSDRLRDHGATVSHPGYETNYNRNIGAEGFSLAGKKYQKAFHDTAMRFRREQGHGFLPVMSMTQDVTLSWSDQLAQAWTCSSSMVWLAIQTSWPWRWKPCWEPSQRCGARLKPIATRAKRKPVRLMTMFGVSDALLGIFWMTNGIYIYPYYFIFFHIYIYMYIKGPISRWANPWYKSDGLGRSQSISAWKFLDGGDRLFYGSRFTVRINLTTGTWPSPFFLPLA